VCAAAFALVAVAVSLHVANRAVAPGTITGWWLTNAVSVAVFGSIGALVASRRRHRLIGWILLSVALGHALTISGREYGIYALAHGLPGASWAIWLGTWAWIDVGLLAIVFALFPDGRLAARWLLPLPVLTVAVELVVAGGNAVYPGPMFSGAPQGGVRNPLGWAWAGRELDRLGYAIPTWTLVGVMAAAALAMLLRLRDPRVAVRRQALSVAPAAIALAAELAYEVNGSDRIGSIVAPVLITILGASIGAAILRYGLYELDLVVNRTLVYVVLSAVLVGAYLAVVAGVQSVEVGHTLASLLAAGLVAVAFAPLRARLQSVVDRLLYGERNDPYAVISSLLSAQDDDVLPALASTVAQTLKLPYVAIELGEEAGELVRAAEVGALRGEPLVLPLVYQGGAIGRLVLGPRTRNDPFTRAEQSLFEDVARQVAIAAHAVRLSLDLQGSRERLVAAREEERRRLRRDLHDGLGPTLAGIALQLESARTIAATDPSAADALLGRLVDETQAAIGSVRHVVYDLRPPALDDVGLVGALRQQAARFPGLEVTVEADGAASELPAAVEVAAYRIAAEAVTNAARHARARRCSVRIAVNGALEVEVADDGVGIAPDAVPGVGLSSIRERAAELGGSCTFGNGAQGTVVRARLPLPA